MADPPTLALSYELAKAGSRRAAAEALARHLGADALLIFVPDAELGTLVPAPGLLQTLPGGPTWRALFDACARPGVHQAMLAYPDLTTLRPATAFVVADGTVFLFVGDGLARERVHEMAMPLLAALLRAEQAAMVARGDAAAAREAARHASTLTVALDAARGDLQRALEEAARLNGELTRAAARERDARAEAEDANRAKDEFLAMLGHELRNPLAPIVTALHLMRLRGDGGLKREREIIERQIVHVIRLVDDLLDVSRITRGKAELVRSIVELGPVVAKAVEMASPLLEERRHHFTMTVPPRGLSLDADEGRLAQVISNLLTNAARYTPPGGDIMLSARRDGDALEIVVSDSGIGIEKEMLGRVFELFVQGKRSSDRAEGGLGLGLALVKTLVAMHGGTVEARSEGRGRGSQFVVRLPARAANPAAPAAPGGEAAPDGAPAARLRVLLVDDNADGAELLGEALRLHGHEVKVAYDGPSALAIVEGFRPDTAVIDIGLPVMDGYELARQLRARRDGRPARIIAMTGYGQQSDVAQAKAKAAGFDHHLVKPVALPELLAALPAPAAP